MYSRFQLAALFVLCVVSALGFTQGLQPFIDRSLLAQEWKLEFDDGRESALQKGTFSVQASPHAEHLFVATASEEEGKRTMTLRLEYSDETHLTGSSESEGDDEDPDFLFSIDTASGFGTCTYMMKPCQLQAHFTGEAKAMVRIWISEQEAFTVFATGDYVPPSPSFLQKYGPGVLLFAAFSLIRIYQGVMDSKRSQRGK